MLQDYSPSDTGKKKVSKKILANKSSMVGTVKTWLCFMKEKIISRSNVASKWNEN